MRHLFSRTLAVLLSVALIGPSVYLTTPVAHAQFDNSTSIANALTQSSAASSFGGAVTSLFGVPVAGVGINDAITAIKSTVTAIATFADKVNTYFLQPLAFILSGNLIKMITAGVLSFVTGAANGTGIPQFVQDLQGHMQMVGDNRALSFFAQFGRNSNSPFAGAIASSLRVNYLQNTSLAGFFAANQNTLARYSPNVDAFLAGDWSQGGVRAWFALTTQSQNNPYTFYQASQNALASAIEGATAARLAELNWGDGFLSWCGPSEIATTDEGDGTGMEGTAPGDACMQSDGTWGTIKTPGSVIKATLDKALGLEWDKIANMGALASEITSILRDVGRIASTVQFGVQLLGGADSGGLFGVSQTSSSYPTSPLRQYESTPLLGVTNTTVYQGATTNAEPSSTDIGTRLAAYESAWGAIRVAATAAQTALTSLSSFCLAAAADLETGTATFRTAAAAQAAAAGTAITTYVAPVLAQADAASTLIAEARAFIQKVASEQNSTDPAVQNAYAIDLITLQTMPPSDTDVLFAKQESQPSYAGAAVASPEGSLTVSGGTTVDRMNLLTSNATALKSSVCTYRPPSSNSNSDPNENDSDD